MTPQERIAELEASFTADAEDDIMDNLTTMEVRDVRYLLRVAKAAVAWRESDPPSDDREALALIAAVDDAQGREER